MKASVRPYGGITVKGSPVKLRAEVILQGKAQWPYWGRFWSEWDWLGHIRPSIDAAAANGANALQINGDGIADGAGAYPSDELFRARVVQICNYAAVKGMVVLWQLGWRPVITFPANTTQRAINIASAAKVAGWVQQISNVVTIDVMNEWDLSPATHWTGAQQTVAGANGNGLADMITYIAAVRQQFTRPLCASVSDYQIPYHASIAPYVDYHNYHNYDWQYGNVNRIPKPSDIAAFKAASWYKGAFVIGETGMPLGWTDGGRISPVTAVQRRAFMTAMLTQATDADCLGCFHWGLFNTTGFPDGLGAGLRIGQWGSVDDTFNPYPDMVDPIRQWPGQL